jgi:hypothetical protein
VPVVALQAQDQTKPGRQLSTPAPLPDLRARASDPAWARRAVGEGVRSCPRAGCREIGMSGSMRGKWKRSHGRAAKAPPDERGGNRHARPTPAAPLPHSTRSAIGCGYPGRRLSPVQRSSGCPRLDASRQSAITSPPVFERIVCTVGLGLNRWRDEAAKVALDHPGDGDRCAVFEKAADNLDADRQAALGMPVRAWSSPAGRSKSRCRPIYSGRCRASWSRQCRACARIAASGRAGRPVSASAGTACDDQLMGGEIERLDHRLLAGLPRRCCPPPPAALFHTLRVGNAVGGLIGA